MSRRKRPGWAMGESHYKAKLTDAQVREIRERHMAYVRGRSYRALALEYGVGESTIRDIVTYRTRINA